MKRTVLVLLGAVSLGWMSHAIFAINPRKTTPPKPPMVDRSVLDQPKPVEPDSVQVLEFLAAEPSPLKQIEMLDVLRTTLRQGRLLDFPKLMVKAEALDGPHLRAARLLVLRAWVESDPDEAWYHGVSLNEPEPYPFLRDLLEVWSDFAPKVAGEALKELPENAARPLRDRMLETLARRDPARAFDLWRELDPQGDSIFSSNAVFNYLAKSSVEDALAKVEQIPLTKRAEAESAIVYVWAQRDPIAVLDWLATHPRLNFNSFRWVQAINASDVVVVPEFPHH